jgi:uncharacterized protein YcbX
MFVSRIGMTHVKCTRFLEVEHAELTLKGIRGDRDFLLIDENGVPLSAGQHRFFLPLRFRYDAELGVLALGYPDGRLFEDELGLSDDPVDIDYLGMRKIAVRSLKDNWNARLLEFSGRKVRLVRVERQGDGIDVLPVTLFTSASLADLELRIGAAVDGRRFRANLTIACPEAYAEDGWDGGLLRVGPALLRVRSRVPRCVVTQMNPESGVNDARTVATLTTYRETVRLPDGLMPEYGTPGFASYAEVVETGTISVGDQVAFHRA